MRGSNGRVLAAGLAVGAALLLLSGCGGAGYYEVGAGVGGYYEDPYYYDDPCCYGKVSVDNYSYEFVDGFFLSPAATGTWTSELLGYPLAPGEGAPLGDFVEGAYDAEAELELGDLVQWFDVFVPGDDLTAFEVY